MTKLFSIVVLSIIMASCAQFIPPTGGPKDITPPSLLETLPKDKTVNFKGNAITLTFDELIDVTNLKQEIIIIPQLKQPLITKIISGKSVKLMFDEKLDSNTTYTLNFRNGIRDLTEKNPSKNLKYVFSTGNKIDSLNISGNISDIQTKKPVLDATFGLYNTTDTVNIFKQKPIYFIKTDSAGNFKLENIKNNKYFARAFTDKNSNVLYDQKTEYIGFIADTISLNKDIALPQIELYKANLTKNKIKKTSSKPNFFQITLDKSSIKTTIVSPTNLTYISKDNVLTIYNMPSTTKDTIKTVFVVQDSLLHLDTLKTKIYFQETKGKTKNIQDISFTSNIKNGTYHSKSLNYLIEFSSPMVKFDSTKIIFKTDTLKTEKPKLKWKNHYMLEVNIETKAKNTTELIFQSNTFTNYKGDTTSAEYSIKNTILGTEELGSIEGFTNQYPKENKIVQLILADNTNEIIEQIITKNKFKFDKIIPNTYTFKVIIDKNNNGIWDPGNLSTGQPPENILILAEPIKVRQNFEIKNIEIK